MLKNKDLPTLCVLLCHVYVSFVQKEVTNWLVQVSRKLYQFSSLKEKVRNYSCCIVALPH